MPMFFPSLKEVKRLAEDMATHQEESKRYRGIIPQTDGELLEARQQLAAYMRSVWEDEIEAMEIEEAVSEGNYYAKMLDAAIKNAKSKRK